MREFSFDLFTRLTKAADDLTLETDEKEVDDITITAGKNGKFTVRCGDYLAVREDWSGDTKIYHDPVNKYQE